MKIEPKHIFTHGASAQKASPQPSFAKTFENKASFHQSAQPLTNRAQLRTSSEADQQLTDHVRSLIKRIPTPFIK